MKKIIKFLIGISLTFLIISCNSEKVDTYAISRSGVLLQDETYDVIRGKRLINDALAPSYLPHHTVTV